MSLISLLLDDLNNSSLNYDSRPFRFDLKPSDLNNCDTIPERIKNALALPSQNFQQCPLSPLRSKSKFELSNVNYGTKEFEFKLNVPDYAANEVTVDVFENFLIVKGEHRNIDDSSRKCTCSSFIKKYRVPDVYNIRYLKSDFSNNILIVRVPVKSQDEIENEPFKLLKKCKKCFAI